MLKREKLGFEVGEISELNRKSNFLICISIVLIVVSSISIGLNIKEKIKNKVLENDLLYSSSEAFLKSIYIVASEEEKKEVNRFLKGFSKGLIERKVLELENENEEEEEEEETVGVLKGRYL